MWGGFERGGLARLGFWLMEEGCVSAWHAWSLWCHHMQINCLADTSPSDGAFTTSRGRALCTVHPSQHPTYSSPRSLTLTSPMGSPSVGSVGWPGMWLPYPRELEWRDKEVREVTQGGEVFCFLCSYSPWERHTAARAQRISSAVTNLGADCDSVPHSLCDPTIYPF